ncbi:beta-hexosaminidase [Paenibacillus sp. JCM 10914]|nr:beta-hexosaminidase [Paenibacillus sp. JCM 10914]
MNDKKEDDGMNRTTIAKLMISVLWIGLMVFFLAACQGNQGAGSTESNGTKEQVSPPNDVKEEPPSDSGEGTDAEPEGLPGANEPEDEVATLLSEMTVQEKIGQLVIVGLDGTAVDDASRKMLEQYQVGGFILFKDNITDTEQVVRLLNDLKHGNAVNPVPLWLSIDEEGGRVTRFPDTYERLPSSGKIGSLHDEQLSKDVGSLIAQKVAGIGMNMVFAPVLDINSNPDNPVIGDRSFGDTAEMVTAQGIASMQGIQAGGVVPVVKHFPGHGDTSVDSHLGLPVVEHDRQRLHELELAPFQAAIQQGADVVMVAHLLMQDIDPKTPSSYSKPVITDLLRGELGFEGVVITDDMTMGAITGTTDVGEASVKSIVAGTNIVLIGHEFSKQEAVIHALTDAVNSGVISEEMLDERVRTTLELKHKYGLDDQALEAPDIKDLNQATKEVVEQVEAR